MSIDNNVNKQFTPRKTLDFNVSNNNVDISNNDTNHMPNLEDKSPSLSGSPHKQSVNSTPIDNADSELRRSDRTRKAPVKLDL